MKYQQKYWAWPTAILSTLWNCFSKKLKFKKTMVATSNANTLKGGKLKERVDTSKYRSHQWRIKKNFVIYPTTFQKKKKKRRD